MHTVISLLLIFFLSKEFHKLLFFHLFKKLVLSDEGVITLVIFQWYSTKKFYCCGLNVQIKCPMLILILNITMSTFGKLSGNYLNSNLQSHLLLRFSTCSSPTSGSQLCKWRLLSSPMQIVVDIQILFYSPPICARLKFDLVAKVCYKLK